MQHLNHPLFHSVCVCAAVALGSWVASLVTKNYSQVDRLWSVMPQIYVAIFAAHAGFADARLNLMTALTLLWGARLTFNFARKGGYKPGGEDYRWPVLRAKMSPLVFQLFNFAFISIYQHVLLLLIALPAFFAYEHRAPFGPWDAAAGVAFLLFLVGETVADEQQWRFHQLKKTKPESLRYPFLTTGLFRFSRHPNFFCEQAMWVCVYAFSVAAGGFNWTAIGCVLLILLFQGSTSFTESLTLKKYPSYAEYQRTTSRLLPLPPK